MAVTINNVNEELIKFRKKAMFAFLRESRFDVYTGTGYNNIIQRVTDLEAGGKQINIPLLDNLRGDGVATGQLVGNEEQLDNYGMPLWADWARHAVAFNKATRKESAFNIRDYGTPALTSWTKRWRRDDMVDTLLSIPTSAIPSGYHTDPGNRVNGVKWVNATAGQRNNWLTANNDRVKFGALSSNTVAGNVSSSLLNVDTTSDKMNRAMGKFLKRTAIQTSNIVNWPAIRPYELEDLDEEWYIAFMGSRAFRDLQTDLDTVDQAARPRETGDPLKENPIYAGSHRQADGVIYREIPEIDQRYIVGTAAGSSDSNPTGPLAKVGATSCDVSPVLMCGQSAFAYVIGQLPQAKRRDETDYQFLEGLGIEMQYGYGKVAKDKFSNAGAVGTLRDWGCVTGFVASAADA